MRWSAAGLFSTSETANTSLSVDFDRDEGSHLIPVSFEDSTRLTAVAASAETVFHYRQEGEVVWATYKGGEVVFGTLLARVDAEGRLDMRYQQLNLRGEWRMGRCRSVPEVLADGRYRLHESWQWLTGDRSSGTSIIEEFREGGKGT